VSNAFEDLPVFAVSGFSGSGKTTLLEGVLPLLRDGGLDVAVVKHDAHGVVLDRRGKDSDRLFHAGADVVLRGPNESAARWHPRSAPTLEAAVDLLAASHDIVLVEGHRDTPLPKLWLLRDGEPEPPPEVAAIRRVLAWGEARVPATVDEVHGFLDATWRERPLCGGILIGGGSSRMGRPKQLLDIGGKSFAERVAAALADSVGRRVLLGEGPVPEPLRDLTRLPDPPGVIGPIAGLVTALRWHPRAAWLVAACDQPLVEPAAFEWLLDQRRPGRWAVLPRTANGPVEPFLAVYEPQAVGLVEDAVATRGLAPRSLADHPKVACPEVPTELAHCWRSVNTPEEYEALRG
jgi:molybdopterin-guanine dinucleotide biosynthesis protein MobB